MDELLAEARRVYLPILRDAMETGHTHPKRVKLHFNDWRYEYDRDFREWSWRLYRTDSVPCSGKGRLLQEPKFEMERRDDGVVCVASAPVHCSAPCLPGAQNPTLMYAAAKVHDAL